MIEQKFSFLFQPAKTFKPRILEGYPFATSFHKKKEKNNANIRCWRTELHSMWKGHKFFTHLCELPLLLPKLGIGNPQLPLRLSQCLDLRGNEAGDVVVRVHRPHPRAEPGHVAASRLGTLVGELLHPKVRQQKLTRLSVDLILLGPYTDEAMMAEMPRFCV